MFSDCAIGLSAEAIVWPAGIPFECARPEHACVTAITAFGCRRVKRDVVDRHKALGNPVRLRILKLLCGAPLYVCEIAASLDLAPSTVSEHLSCLRRGGLVDERKEGRWVLFHHTLPLGMLREVKEMRLNSDEVRMRVVRRGPKHQRPPAHACGRGETTRRAGAVRPRRRGE